MREIEEIYQEMLTAFADRAGFVPEEGCDLAVRLYAAAAQLQALSIQADWVLDQSFPQTAQGVFLDRHGALRGIRRGEAERAKGTLRFSVDRAGQQDLTIAAGTECMTPAGRRFASVQEAVLRAGETTVDVPAQAVDPGSDGNAVAGTVTLLSACPVGITACTNPAAFTGGCDEEDDETLRLRILESYRRLPNGANAAWYRQTAMGHRGVAAASVIGRARGIGTVDVYIAGHEGLPEEALLTEVQEDLSRNREIAVSVRVLPPVLRKTPVAVEVAVAENADPAEVRQNVEKALRRFFDGAMLGRSLLRAELGQAVFSVEGVKNYRLLLPDKDLVLAPQELPVPERVDVSEMKEVRT